jgi:hypothetical protein
MRYHLAGAHNRSGGRRCAAERPVTAPHRRARCTHTRLQRLRAPFPSSAHSCAGASQPLADAVTDGVDGIVVRHVLLLQEMDGMALTSGEDAYKDLRACHRRAAEPLCLDHPTLRHALKARARSGRTSVVNDQFFRVVVDVARCSFSAPRSTAQAFVAAEASTSSISASRRCSSVACSCFLQSSYVAL